MGRSKIFLESFEMKLSFARCLLRSFAHHIYQLIALCNVLGERRKRILWLEDMWDRPRFCFEAHW